MIRTRGYGWGNDSICHIVFQDFLCARQSYNSHRGGFCLSSQSLQFTRGDKQVTRQCPKSGVFCDDRRHKCAREGVLEKVASNLDLHFTGNIASWEEQHVQMFWGEWICGKFWESMRNLVCRIVDFKVRMPEEGLDDGELGKLGSS